MQNDSLVNYIDHQNHMRVVATDCTISVDDARIRHRMFATPAVSLGRLIAGGLLMASTLQHKAVVTLKIVSDGPLQALTVDASYEGNVRGYCLAPQLDMPLKNGRVDVAGAIGMGQLQVRKLIDETSQPYVGVVELYTREISGDLAYYYYHSEQIPTAISLGVYVGTDGRVKAAGGILVQALPPQEDNFLEKLETIFSRSPAITELILGGMNADGIVQSYLPGFSLQRQREISPMFRCGCHREKSEKALIALGPEELKKMIMVDEFVDITCEYCGQHYYFKKKDLQEILARI